MEHTSGTPINMCRNETENTVDALFLTNVTDPSDVRRNDTRKKEKRETMKKWRGSASVTGDHQKNKKKKVKTRDE